MDFIERKGVAQFYDGAARLFTDVMDNTDVFFKIMRVAIGGNREGRWWERDDD